MSNGFPYWQFHNDRWLAGKVSSFGLKGQGLFLQFCMAAWAARGPFNVCSTSVQLRFNEEAAWVDSTIAAMLKIGILTQDGDKYRIKFIDDQIGLLTEAREQQKAAGRASAAARRTKSADTENTERIEENSIVEKSRSLKNVQQTLSACSTVVQRSLADEAGKVPEIIPQLQAETPKPLKRFAPPTVEEVRAYCIERKNSVDPEQWHDSYTSKGWMVGKVPMKDWKAAVRTWEKNGFDRPLKDNERSVYEKPQPKLNMQGLS